MSVEIPIHLKAESALALRSGPSQPRSFWCMHCDEVWSDLVEFMVHGCPIGPVPS
jgi:hypothetical protein